MSEVGFSEVLVKVPAKYAKTIEEIAKDLCGKETFEEWRKNCDPTNGQLLRALRIRRNLSQKEFSKKVNFSSGLISKMENDVRPISEEEIKLFSSVLNIPENMFNH